MNLLTFLTTIVVLTNSYTGELDFTVRLKKDREILQSDHFVGDITQLKQFKQFSSVDLKQFHYSKTQIGKNQVEKWTSKTNEVKSIMRIKTIVKVDTIFKFSDTTPAGISHRQHHIKTAFKFTSYQFIKQATSKPCTYISIDNEGLAEYGMNGKVYHISYESIALGLHEIYLPTITDIKSIWTKNKNNR